MISKIALGLVTFLAFHIFHSEPVQQHNRLTVILLPGGGWQNADPHTMQPWVDDFKAHGIHAIAITYPLRDVNAAIDYVRGVVKRTPGKVVVYGISAGGTIAAALAAEGSVAAGVNIVGPTDFTRWISPGGLYIMRQIGMKGYAQKKSASPYWRLTPKVSPQLIQCGLVDPIVTYEQCIRYYNASKKSQASTRLDGLVDAHGQLPRDRDAARRWVTQVTDTN